MESKKKRIMSSTSSKSLVQYWVMCCLGYSISALEAGSMSLLAAAQLLIRSLITLDGDFSMITICSDIKRWCSQFESIHYRQVHREENAVAHELAKRITTAQPFTSSSCFIPYWLTNVLCNDYIH
ncbi:hypothetical protein YC2023_025614 [Brassica napus]